jgi:hypothetical protein
VVLEGTPPYFPAAYGEVFTRRWVVDVLLNLAGYTPDRALAGLTLVEPACGSGAFLLPAVHRLVMSLEGSSVDRADLADAVRAWDIQEPNVQRCRRAIVTMLAEHGYGDDASWLAARWVQHGDYLLDPEAGRPAADVVVGNPPYVRLEDVPVHVQSRYRSRWHTMGGRADLYVGFIEKGLRSLRPGGKLAFICADRWMRNQYGGALRAMIAAEFSVDAIWTMHDVDAFETQVSSYPAVTVISRNSQGPAVVAETTATFAERPARDLARWTTQPATAVTAEGTGYRAHRLPHWFTGDEFWPTGSPERLALVEHLNDNFPPLHEPAHGSRVGIGVATGADKIFLTTDPTFVEPSRLLPLAMVADVRSGTFAWRGTYLINPWETDGTPVDLTGYPRLARYLNRHRRELSGRHIARRSAKRWYHTIDKVNHGLVDKPKLLIQDMRTSINPVLDGGGFYPHHNLYFVVSESWDLEVLGGLLLSRVAQTFIEAYCVRMRGNTLRFQAQYLRKIRVPRYDEIPGAVREDLAKAFRNRDVAHATSAALDAYKIDNKTLID